MSFYLFPEILKQTESAYLYNYWYANSGDFDLLGIALNGNTLVGTDELLAIGGHTQDKVVTSGKKGTGGENLPLMERLVRDVKYLHLGVPIFNHALNTQVAVQAQAQLQVLGS